MRSIYNNHDDNAEGVRVMGVDLTEHVEDCETSDDSDVDAADDDADNEHDGENEGGPKMVISMVMGW